MYDRHMKIGKWTRDMVRTFISNEVYIGTVVNHKSTVLNFRTKNSLAEAAAPTDFLSKGLLRTVLFL